MHPGFHRFRGLGALQFFWEHSLQSGCKKSISWGQTFDCIPGFHNEVTKIQTKKLLVLLSFYFHVWGITPRKHFYFCKLPGKLLWGIKTLPIFWDSVTSAFLSQNIYYSNLQEFLKQWIHAFVGKLTLERCFCWFPATRFMPLKGTPTWHCHTKLYKFWWNLFS